MKPQLPNLFGIKPAFGGGGDVHFGLEGIKLCDCEKSMGGGGGLHNMLD